MPTMTNMENLDDIIANDIEDSIIADDQMPDTQTYIHVLRCNGASFCQGIEFFNG